MKTQLYLGAGAAALTVLPLLFLACSDNNGVTNSPGTGGAAGSAAGGAPAAGTTGAGGAQAAGGMNAAGGMQQGGAAGSGTTGGMAGMGGDVSEKALRVCQARAPQDPGGMGMMGEMCCGGKGACGPM